MNVAVCRVTNGNMFVSDIGQGTVEKISLVTAGANLGIDADNLPKGSQAPISRILFNDGGVSKTLLQLIKEKNTKQGKAPAGRADLRFGQGPNGQIFVLNKRDGAIRLPVR
jgi:hypothetical protein